MCLSLMSWVQQVHNAAVVARSLGCQCGGTIGETVHILQVNPVSFLLRED
jgi:hypothetical protein